MEQEVTVTKAMISDANMEVFLAYIWKNDLSRAQVKKLQGFFFPDAREVWVAGPTQQELRGEILLGGLQQDSGGYPQKT